MSLCCMLGLYMLRMQVEKVRVNKEKARSMESRVKALMRFLVVSFGWQLRTHSCQSCVDCKVHPDRPPTLIVHRL